MREGGETKIDRQRKKDRTKIKSGRTAGVDRVYAPYD